MIFALGCAAGGYRHRPDGADLDVGDVPTDSGLDFVRGGEVCGPGIFRPCGPCDLGVEECGDDGRWSGNCDGLAQGVPKTPLPCYTGTSGTLGIGECQEGMAICTYDEENGNWIWGECVGEIRDEMEICDGLDNDCDGLADENPLDETPWREKFYSGPFWTEEIGICRAGWRICQSARWFVEEDEITPTAEVCDHLDNNCDGRQDEGLLNACGQCGPEPIEICNGRDDDCDGRVDDNTSEECGGCLCTDGHCEEPFCPEESCGRPDNCGGTCQDCPPGEECVDDAFCRPIPVSCIVSDSFYFGNDFISHDYAASPGVHPGISPDDSCGAALGVYFDHIGDWAHVALAVVPTADVIRINAHANTSGVTVEADGFDCDGWTCWVSDDRCRPNRIEWRIPRLSHDIVEDGVVEFVFRAAVERGGRTDIALAEVESCNFIR